jgi:hypothetical protein
MLLLAGASLAGCQNNDSVVRTQVPPAPTGGN